MSDDPIGDAIETAEAKEQLQAAQNGIPPDSLVGDATLKSGKHVRLIVPREFGPDEFESCVGILMQLRVASEQAMAAREDGLLLPPDKPTIVDALGRPL